IHQYNYPFFISLGQPENIKVLPFKSSSGIYNQQAYIGMFNSPHRAHNGVKLQVLLYLGLSSDSCSINQIKFKTKTIVFCICAITGSPCNICNYKPVFTQQCIYKGRFAGIRAAYNSKPWKFINYLFFYFRQGFNQGI